MIPRSMDKTASRVSDERLAEIVTKGEDVFYGWPQGLVSKEAVKIATELQSLRSLSSDSVSDGSKGVRVKPLDWEQSDNGNGPFWRGSRPTLVITYFVHEDGKWCSSADPTWRKAASLELAKAAAQADYEQRILSTIALDSGTGGQQPVTMGRDGLDEWIIGELSNAKALSTDGMSVMTTTATVLRAVREALSVYAPTEPKAGVVSEETRAFIDAVQLVEDAGWIILRPQRLRKDAGDQGPVSEEIGGFLYALLGSDTWLEAVAIWEQNPEQRKAAHAFFGAALNGDKP